MIRNEGHPSKVINQEEWNNNTISTKRNMMLEEQTQRIDNLSLEMVRNEANIVTNVKA